MYVYRRSAHPESEIGGGAESETWGYQNPEQF